MSTGYSRGVELEPLEPGRAVVADREAVEDEELWQDDSGDDHSGWWCVATDPFPCPAAGCSFVANHMTAAHLILVEEELMILDGETLAPVAAVDVLVRGAEARSLPGRLKTELHASVVELNTDVCADVDEALAALRELRTAAAEIAAANGLSVAAAGSHPTAPLESLPVV